MLSRNLGRLRSFVQQVNDVVDRPIDDRAPDAAVYPLLCDLIAHDDWLPDEFAQPAVDRFKANLLYCDLRDRFSIVCFVWDCGQGTPIHDHSVWGLMGLLRGKVLHEQIWHPRQVGGLQKGDLVTLQPGEVSKIAGPHGDIHAVFNDATETLAVSIHVYGGNIGTLSRRAYDPELGAVKTFVSGYSNASLPNLWGPAPVVPSTNSPARDA